MRILLYQAQQNQIGGCETFNLNFCKRLSKYYDITFLCETGDPHQLQEIGKYAEVVIYEGQIFETDVCIFSSAWGIRPADHITADRYIQMIHADFRGIEKHWNFHYKALPEITEHWAGGENIAKTFEEKYGLKCKVIPYLLDIDTKPEPVLHLISTTRIAKEKGMFRVVKMAKMLKATGRKFNWDIWGSGFDANYVNKIKNKLTDVPEVSFRGVGRDLISYVADADYLVQLSDTEGYAFSIFESLGVAHTPVIATAFPNAYEQIEDGKTGFILPFELFSEEDLKVWNELFDKMYQKLPKVEFKELSTEQDWIKMIGKPTKKKRKTKIIQPKQVKVKCIKPYFDMVLKCKVKRDKIYDVSELRGNELSTKGLVQILQVHT